MNYCFRLFWFYCWRFNRLSAVLKKTAKCSHASLFDKDCVAILAILTATSVTDPKFHSFLFRRHLSLHRSMAFDNICSFFFKPRTLTKVMVKIEHLPIKKLQFCSKIIKTEKYPYFSCNVLMMIQLRVKLYFTPYQTVTCKKCFYEKLAFVYNILDNVWNIFKLNTICNVNLYVLRRSFNVHDIKPKFAQIFRAL